MDNGSHKIKAMGSLSLVGVEGEGPGGRKGKVYINENQTQPHT